MYNMETINSRNNTTVTRWTPRRLETQIANRMMGISVCYFWEAKTQTWVTKLKDQPQDSAHCAVSLTTAVPSQKNAPAKKEVTPTLMLWTHQQYKTHVRCHDTRYTCHPYPFHLLMFSDLGGNATKPWCTKQWQTPCSVRNVGTLTAHWSTIHNDTIWNFKPLHIFESPVMDVPVNQNQESQHFLKRWPSSFNSAMLKCLLPTSCINLFWKSVNF